MLAKSLYLRVQPTRHTPFASQKPPLPHGTPAMGVDEQLPELQLSWVQTLLSVKHCRQLCPPVPQTDMDCALVRMHSPWALQQPLAQLLAVHSQAQVVSFSASPVSHVSSQMQAPAPSQVNAPPQDTPALSNVDSHWNWLQLKVTQAVDVPQSEAWKHSASMQTPAIHCCVWVHVTH